MTTPANGHLSASQRHVDSVTQTTVTSLSMYTPVVKSSSLLSSPLCATSRWTANCDNTVPSMTLHASRPIPSTIEEHPVPASICQQTTVEIHTDAPLQCSDVVVRTAVRSRPVTARQPRASVHGRTVSMPSWRPVNLDVANDSQHHHHTLRVIPPIPAAATPKICLDQVDEVGACQDFADVQEIGVSSPKTHGDVARGCGLSSTAAISISLSGCATVVSGRRMSHVTPDFDPPPPRRCDPPPPIVASQQVYATPRQIHPDERRPVRSSRSRDGSDAANKADLDAARRRYFSIAEWNRQKVLHLRRASLRRACLIGIPLSWTRRTGPADRRQSRDGGTTKGRRRQASTQQKTTDMATGRKPQCTTAEFHSKSYSINQSLPPISEALSFTADSGRATRRRATTKSDKQQIGALSSESTQKRATAYTSRCPPLTLLAQHSRPAYITSHKTSLFTYKQPEANETVTAPSQPKPEAYDSGLDSDAATRTTTEHQSLPATTVDLQKVKDVLENPPSKGRTLKDNEDNDEHREIKATSDENDVIKMTRDENDVSCSNSVEHVEKSNYVGENSRPTVLVPRYERYVYQCRLSTVT